MQNERKYYLKERAVYYSAMIAHDSLELDKNDKNSKNCQNGKKTS